MRGITIYLVLACAVPVVAQTNVQGDSRQRLIKLNVAATSAKGDPVTDLSAADLQLREDGKPQPIAFFRFAGRQAPTVLHAQGEFVNHPVTAPLVILLDRWNERMMTTAQAWIELGTAVQHLESVESVYIYFLTNEGNLFPVRPLPVTDADLRAATVESPVELRAKLDETLRNLQGFRARDDLGVRIQTTFQALDALRLQMSSITGSKNLIWITHGIPLVIRSRSSVLFDLTPQVRSFSEMAALAQIAIYTVDQSSGSGANLSDEVLALRMFSALTGGRWYPSDNAERSIADARTDARGSYRIAYYSTVAEKDNKEHKIRVDATRKGIHLLTRERFVAEVPQSDPDQLEAAAFDSGRRSPFDAAEIGLRVAMSRKPAAKTAHFEIHVDLADIMIEHRDGRYRAELDVTVVPYSQEALKDPSPATRLKFDFTQPELDEAAKAGMVIPMDAAVSDQTQKVRVMVFDRRLQALGSVTIAMN